MSKNSTHISQTINHLNECEYKWFAVYTKYKCEKYVCEQLSKKGIACYLPLLEKVKRYSSKVKRYQIPLINCYVFVKITKPEYVSVLETEYVMKFLKQRGSLISIPEREIEILKKVVGNVSEVVTEDISYNVGDSVEIVAGELTGIRGNIVEEKGKNNVVVQLASIGLQLRMSVDKTHLRLLKSQTVA